MQKSVQFSEQVNDDTFLLYELSMRKNVADIRMKNLEQLKFSQQLHEDGILAGEIPHCELC